MDNVVMIDLLVIDGVEYRNVGAIVLGGEVIIHECSDGIMVKSVPRGHRPTTLILDTKSFNKEE